MFQWTKNALALSISWCVATPQTHDNIGILPLHKSIFLGIFSFTQIFLVEKSNKILLNWTESLETSLIQDMVSRVGRKLVTDDTTSPLWICDIFFYDVIFARRLLKIKYECDISADVSRYDISFFDVTLVLICVYITYDMKKIEAKSIQTHLAVDQFSHADPPQIIWTQCLWEGCRIKQSSSNTKHTWPTSTTGETIRLGNRADNGRQHILHHPKEETFPVPSRTRTSHAPELATI